jgi:phosphohistidine swiveling domain-containing protein
MSDLYSISNLKKYKWGVLEPNEPIHLYPVMYPGWSGAIAGTGDYLGKYQKNIACLHVKEHGLIFIDHDEWNKLGKFGLNKLIKDPDWGFGLNRIIIKNADGLIEYASKNIFKANLKNKTNYQLYQLYKKYLNWQSKVYNPSLLPVYMDLYKPYLTSYLVEYLNKQVRKLDYHQTAKECFATLTIPKNFSKIQEEEIDLFKIAGKIRKKKFNKKTLPKLVVGKMEDHIKKYKYQGYNWEGPAFSDAYFWNRLKKVVQDKVKPTDQVKKMKAEKAHALKIHDELVKDLKIDQKHQKLLEITQGFIYTKDYRKMALVQSYYELEPLLIEISKRVYLSLAEFRNCLLPEVKQILEGKLTRPADLSKRMQGCLFVVVEGKLPGVVYVGEKFRTMKHYLLKREDLTEVNYFHGQTASLGKASGTVRVINSIKDLKKMKQGNILVSTMTNPDLVPAMKKAGAIVTDLGGVTCHAAIVSRELKIPCVIGTKIATKVLKDGDKINVDANNAEIKRI